MDKIIDGNFQVRIASQSVAKDVSFRTRKHRIQRTTDASGDPALTASNALPETTKPEVLSLMNAIRIAQETVLLAIGNVVKIVSIKRLLVGMSVSKVRFLTVNF